jgi:hypothetical protein
LLAEVGELRSGVISRLRVRFPVTA